MNLAFFQVSQDETIKEALKQIDENHHGIVLLTDEAGKVTGLSTDGDIRRCLIDGNSIDDKISTCSNTNFVWAEKGVSREQLLKQLDNSIRIVPILDEAGLLVGIINRDSIPHLHEEKVYARSRAPVRVSFGGGGSDLTHFFWDFNGAVINATVSLYSHTTLRLRSDNRVIIHSLDLGESMDEEDLDAALLHKGRFGLIQAVLKVIKPDYGFELYINSDFPMGSGLGGSAVVATAILGCFNEFRRDKWDNHEIAELAFQAERFNLGISGGWQDQYASVFGGFNFIEFQKKQNIIHPLRIKPNVLLELEESLVLCNTGTFHDSGNIHDNQKEHMKKEDVQEKVKINVDLTYEMRNNLLRGKLYELGQKLNTAWMLKRGFSSKISNSFLDDIYTMALENGAVGGKLLGAGGGGFFLFFVTPFKKHQLIQAMEKQGLKSHPFRFDQDGLKSWMVRESQ